MVIEGKRQAEREREIDREKIKNEGERREKNEGERGKKEGERGKETERVFKTGFKASHRYNLVLTKNTVLIT